MNAIPELEAFVGSVAMPRRAAFLLLPGFSLTAFATATDVLSAVNSQSGCQFYEWQMVGLDADTVSASDGTTFALDNRLDGRLDGQLDCQAGTQGTIDGDPLPEVLFICGGDLACDTMPDCLLDLIQDMTNLQRPIISIGSATSLLAESGCLDGRRAAVYWEDLPAFQDRYPDVRAHSGLYEKDGAFYTAPGGAAVLDMMLRFVQEQHYAGLVSQICDLFLTDRMRDASERQRRRGRREPDLQSKTILAIIDLMEDNIRDPLSSTTIAQKVGLSRRQIERLFMHYLHCSPNRYYLELRLSYARQLIVGSDRPIAEIASAHGFRSPAHFAKRYREIFEVTPIHDRRGAGARLQINHGYEREQTGRHAYQ